MSAFLHAFGSYLPERVVTNDEIGACVGKDAVWIESASGIRERRWAHADETVADLALRAGEACLNRAGVSPSSLGMIILASGSARPGFPGSAAEVAARLGLESTPVLDIPMASAGSLFGLAIASHMAESMGDVLVIGAEKMSAILESAPLDANTAILFGDGAGAALVSARPGRWEITDSVLHTDGQFRDVLRFDWSGPLHMDGLSVIMQSSRKIPSAIAEVLSRNNVAASDVQAFLLHQANQNLLVRIAKALGVATDRVFSNVARYGNTSSASMLIAAAEWEQTGAARGPVVFGAFGAGINWGALLAR
jgi:3-oxoacyl-[acyl-carrier-protein] synthase III